jgi:hypothetical protein
LRQGDFPLSHFLYKRNIPAVTLAVVRIASLERIQPSASKNLDQYNEFMQMLECLIHSISLDRFSLRG